LNNLGQVYHGGAVKPVLLGMLLMVLVFSIERLFQKQLVKPNLDAFMTKIKLVSSKVKLKKLSQM
jgi:biopolymer transport protein ExbB